jgi:hypothetical protein
VPVGKKFAGWEIDGKTYQVGDTVNLTGTITIAKAIWEDSGESPRGDMDGSGTITADDAQYILIYATQVLAGFNPKWDDIIIY